MTLAEMERGFELHEKRFARIEASIEAGEERLKKIEDNLLVQGELLNRVDQKVDRLTDMFEQGERERAGDHERMRLMQAAMTSLFERMDAFIRGLERNDGHERPSSQ